MVQLHSDDALAALADAAEREAPVVAVIDARRREGATRDELLTAARKTAAGTVGEDRLVQLVEDRLAQPPAFRNTDVGNAERLLFQYGDDLRYCPEHKRWYIWNGIHWRPDRGGEVLNRAKDVPRGIYAEAASEPDENRRRALAAHATRSENRARIEAMPALALTSERVRRGANEFDPDPGALGVPNGTVDLRTGELREPRREDHITKCAGVAFDPAARSPRWDAFLDRIMAGDAELIAFLQRVVGYLLTGLTSEQCLFLFLGSGANGKSVFLNVMQRLLGDYARQTPAETLMVRDGRSASNDIARLQGARLVCTSEVEDGQRFAESLVKQLTGQDVITGRFLYAEPFEFRPQFKIAIAGNHPPIIRGDDPAAWRRIKLVPFTVTIPEDERDPELVDKLCAELPGILNWALEGLRDWREHGLQPPEAVRAATEEYRTDMDVLRAWIDECCALDAGAWAASRELYDSYQKWARENTQWVMSRQKFGRRMKERFQQERRGGGSHKERGFRGLTVMF